MEVRVRRQLSLGVLKWLNARIQRSFLDFERSDPEIRGLRRVMEDSNLKKEIEDAGKRFLNASKEYLNDKSVNRVKTLLRWRHPVEEILKVAEGEKPDLVVLGSRGKRVQKAFLGSVSREVSDRAKVSVMLGR